MSYQKCMNVKLLSVNKIWGESKHSAFPDLILFNHTWFATFRESDKHVHGKNGVIHLISSPDGDSWESVGHFEEEGVDLRDPKLCVTSDHRLMLHFEGVVYENKKYVTRQPRVTFSHDGYTFGPVTTILQPHEWLWRVTWHSGRAYGVSYRSLDPKDKNAEWQLSLYSSQDGIHYELIKDLEVTGLPNETTLRLLPNERMVALVRREKKYDNKAVLGYSDYPYENWTWQKFKKHLGGPNFVVLPSGKMIAGGRLRTRTPYGVHDKTVIAFLDDRKLDPLLVLPSGGDSSYPGMVLEGSILWVCYYSSHEKNTCIYLAKIDLSQI